MSVEEVTQVKDKQYQIILILKLTTVIEYLLLKMRIQFKV